MRTDVKVGLVCVFAVVLAVVCYFTLHDKNRAVIATSSNTPTSVTSEAPSAGSATLSIAPPATAPSATANDLSTTPSLASAGSGNLLGSSSLNGQVSPPTNNFSGTISPPGAATQSAANGMGGSVGLTPPGSMTTPLIPSPGLTSPGTSSGTSSTPGLSTSPLLPSSTGSSSSSSILPPTSPFSSPSDNNLKTVPTTPATPKHGKNGKSKLPASTPGSMGSTIDLTSPTGGSTVDLLGGGSTSGSGSSYAIQKGDTLGAVAKRNGVTVKAILAANPGVNPNRLKVGQKVNIPAAGETPATRPASSNRSATTRSSAKKTAKSAAHPAANAGGTYTVKKGDTLRKIAKSVYGDENMWQRIFRANRGDLASPNDITVGEVIKLPSTK